jgi:5'-3' exonuclease
MRVHLVDGTYELFRAFFAAPPSRTSGGTEVGATRAFCRTLLRLLRGPGVTHVAAAFDTVIESFRNDLFPGYKTSEGVPAELMSQFPLAERAARALGVVTWPMIEFETDDALATAAARFAADPRVEQVVICSPDKDFAQCVRGRRVVLWDRRRDRVYDEAGVVEKWGVPPTSIPDWLALVGDDADGIPGVRRWGSKSATAVLARFGRVESIPADVRAWGDVVRGAPALAESLKEHRSQLPLYKMLATLRLDVPLSEVLCDLEWRGAHRGRLLHLCDEIEDPDLIGRVERWSEDALQPLPHLEGGDTARIDAPLHPSEKPGSASAGVVAATGFEPVTYGL